MSYSIIQDVYDRITQEIADELAGGDPAIITQCITDADDEINGYVAVRYSVPLADPIPGIIRKCSVDIACYNLFSRMGLDEDQADEIIEKRYKHCAKLMSDIASGKFQLPIGDTDPTTPEVSVDSRSRTKKYGDLFDEVY